MDVRARVVVRLYLMDDLGAMVMNKTPEQEAFDAAKLGWSLCKDKAALEEKIRICSELAVKLAYSDPRHGLVTIMRDCLPTFEGFNPKVEHHWLRRGDFVTDYRRKAPYHKGQIVKIWKEDGHTESVDVKFGATDYKSYSWSTLKHNYGGSRTGYIVGD